MPPKTMQNPSKIAQNEGRIYESILLRSFNQNSLKINTSNSKNIEFV